MISAYLIVYVWKKFGGCNSAWTLQLLNLIPIVFSSYTVAIIVNDPPDMHYYINEYHYIITINAAQQRSITLLGKGYIT